MAGAAGREDRRGLRRSLVAGAVYDLGLALVILLAGQSLLARLGAGLPEACAFYLRLGALPLLLLPALYLAAAAAGDPDPFRAAVLWARGGGGAALLVFTLLDGPQPFRLFLALGLMDLIWCGLHWRLWRVGPGPRSAGH